jgi:Mg2+ and Co2+ transporter CorA
VERLSSFFDLTDDQNDRLKTLLDSQQENFREMRREIREHFAHLHDEVHAALSEILTVEQMQRFEAEFVRMGDPPSPRGPRPPQQ